MGVRRGRSVVRPSMSPQRSFLTRVTISHLTAGHSASSCLSFLQEGTVQTFNFCTSRPDVRQCLVVKHTWLTCQKNKPNHINDPRSLQIEVRSAVSSSMHPWPENWMAIGRAVVYSARATHVFIAGIKCRHCRWLPSHNGTFYRTVHL